MELPSTIRRAYTRTVPVRVRRGLESIMAGPYPRVYDRRRFIFIHIPKTAGKSICRMIGVRGARHLKYRDYEEILGGDIDEYFVFTVVRHPMDRLISAWTYMQNGGNHSHNDFLFRDRWIRPFPSLNTFVLHALQEPEVGTRGKFQPQVEFLKGRDGQIVDTVKIIYFESLADGVAELPSRVLKKSILEHINPSVRQPVALDNEALAVVAHFYKEDFEFLKYPLP